MSDKIQDKFDLAIALALSSWPSLTLAVQNLWGGPDSLEKRDWFAGAISDLVAATPDADVEYLEEFLLQVMNDEFEVNVDDGSGAEVASKILGLRQSISQGDFAKVDEMYNQWTERQNKGITKLNFQQVGGEDEDRDTDWDSDDLDEDHDEDMEMEEVPALVESSHEKQAPLIDEDGFTKVVGRRRR